MAVPVRWIEAQGPQVKDDQSSLGGGVNRFQTTRWSVVLVSAQSPLLAEAMDRLRKQYTATVPEEISRTVSDAADVDTETHELCEALIAAERW